MGLVPGVFVESVVQEPSEGSKARDQETWPRLKIGKYTGDVS